MIGRGLGFTRWYDRIPELSQAVRMMEVAPKSHQQAIASAIVGSLQMNQIIQRAEHGLKKLGSEKVLGLMKSKGKRRWYDQDPTVHLAFNYLYLMDDLMRHETAVKMIVSMKALEEASKKGMPSRIYPSLTKGIFEKPLFILLEKLEFIVQPRKNDDDDIEFTPDPTSVATPMMEKTLSEVVGEPPAEEPATATSSTINASADGMKIIKLRQL